MYYNVEATAFAFDSIEEAEEFSNRLHDWFAEDFRNKEYGLASKIVEEKDEN